MQKEMATHSSTLAWNIPWMEEPGRLQSMVAKSRTRLSERLHFLSIVPFGEGNGNPLQCSGLENPMDGGAWWAIVYGVAKSRTQLNTHTHSLMKLPMLPKANNRFTAILMKFQQPIL